MAKSVVSMEIGEKQTRIALLKLNKKKQRVKRALIFDTPEGVIEDGYITDCGTFAKVLRREMKKAKIRKKRIVFTLSSNKIVNREVIVGAVKPNKIANIVETEAQDYFPMGILDHAVSYIVLEQSKEKQQSRLMVYAVPDTLLQNYYELADKLRRSVASIDCMGNSQYQWLRRSDFEEVSMVIQINGTTSAITIFQGQVMGIQRTLSYGINFIADALWESDEFGEVMTREIAAELLHEMPILAVAMEADKRERWQEELLYAARMFASNVARVMQYYSTKNPGVSVQRVYITGEGARVDGMRELLREELQIPVEIFNVTEGVKFKKQAARMKDEGFALFGCLGAVVKPLGLRPYKLIMREKILSAVAGVSVLTLAVAGVFTYLIRNAGEELEQAERSKARLEQRIEKKEAIEELEAKCVTSDATLLTAMGADAMTNSVTELLPELIEVLERVLPRRSMVYSLSVNEAMLTMNFSTVTKEEAAEVLLQLKALPYFSNVQVAGITENANAATGLSQVAFTVNCILVDYREGTEAE
ncbi:MAG: pilus assembly protein PilM [Lachnospiraceae bacterium]|nr:pilus assembly protein PilM [Lachnospiraceae bacterium]